MNPRVRLMLISAAVCVILLQPAVVVQADQDYAAWWQDRFSGQDDIMKTGEFRVLLAGDSITRRFESTGAEAWMKHLKPYHPLNFGVDGDITDQLRYRLEHALPGSIRPKACTVLIGVNDIIHGQEPSIVAGKIHDIVVLLAERLPGSRVYLFCIFPAEQTPGKIRKAITETNAILKDHQYPQNVRIVDLTDLFITEDGLLTDAVSPDQLHLSEKGYEIWGQVIHTLINRQE